MYINSEEIEGLRNGYILDYVFCWIDCRNVGVF